MIDALWPQTLAELIAALLNEIGNLKPPEPEFTYRIGWYPEYEMLFKEQPEAETSIEGLAEAALATGRVILSGRGGGAKSEVLRRLATLQLKQGRVVSLVDLKRWSRANVSLWDTLQSAPERVDFLLSELGTRGLDLRRLSAVPRKTPTLLLIDGLNEVSTPIGQQIIQSLEQFVRYAQNVGVIVADRLVRRSFPDVDRWTLASVLPLDETQVRALLAKGFGNSDRYDRADPGTHAMLCNPYFLSALLKNNSDATTIAELIRERFRQHARVTNAELSLLATTAFAAYKEYGSRTFPLDWFAETVHDDVVARLREAGLLSVQEQAASFDHHLTHDFLVAMYLVENDARWESSAFDVVSFRASSFDALALAVQQIADSSVADTFVRRVYDWNIYGAAYALTEGRPLNAQRSSVSVAMETAMLGMVTMRRWDLITSTQLRARDALDLFPKDVAAPFLALNNEDELSRFLEQSSTKLRSPEGWFERWKEIFTGKIPLNAENAVSSLQESDVFGWTFANAMRRSKVDDRIRAALFDALKGSADKTVRWRIVHALGIDATRETADVLLTVLRTDNDTWVRYGAVRALIEIAARGDRDVREHVFREIEHSASELRTQDRVVRELRAAIAIDPEKAPKAWLHLTNHMIETFYQLEPAPDVRRDWERLAYELRSLYDTEHVA